MEEQISQNQELIQISETEINGVLTKTVNARDLHSFLESKQDFSTWIKNRIVKYDFIENQDLIVFHKKWKTLKEVGQCLNMPLPLTWQKSFQWLRTMNRAA